MFSSRGVCILFHIIGWLLFFGLVIGSSAINRDNTLADIFSPPFLLFYAVYLVFFYLNELVLLPKLYLKKRYGLYIAVTGILLVGVALLQPFDRIVKGQRESVSDVRSRPLPLDRRPPGPPRLDQRPPGQRPPQQGPQRVDIVSIVLFITLWTVGMAMALFRQWRQTERRAAQAEIEKATAELSFLKAQINPHFLFNTLNNVYSLAVEKSDRAPDAIMKLSNMMRYVTDEAKNDFVPLADELSCMRDYIALQQLRLTDRTTVDFTTTGAYETLQIAPLILMPFVENVFKYGVSAHHHSTINITLGTKGQTLHFFCRNTIVKTGESRERTGIGLQNTKARLQHLYPERHILILEKEDDLFTVQLTIQL